MDTDRCWDIIEAARSDVPVDWNALGEHDLDQALATALIAHLVQLSADEIAEFEALTSALRDHLDRDDVYHAAFLLTHGCGDDGFSDFRAGVVGLGRHWYDLVLQDPDHLAEHPAVRGIVTGTVDQHVLRMEAFQFATTDAYGQVTGDEDALYDHADRVPVTADDDPPPASLSRLPRLAAMFPDAQQTYERFHPSSA